MSGGCRRCTKSSNCKNNSGVTAQWSQGLTCMVMQQASDALSKTADSDTVSTYQVSSMQLMTDKKLEAWRSKLCFIKSL